MKIIYIGIITILFFGFFGVVMQTDAALSPTSTPPTISVTGPSTLVVSTIGMWTASAYDSNGGLSLMTVAWGDGTYASSTLYGSSTALRTFAHKYTAVGIKYPLFKVFDTTNLSASVTKTVQVTATSTSTSTPVFMLTVQKFGTGSGTATGPGINCGTDCSESYASGTTVTLSAFAGSYSRFAGWAGCDIATGTKCIVGMNTNRSVAVGFNSTTSTPKLQLSSSLYEALRNELDDMKQRLFDILSTVSQ